MQITGKIHQRGIALFRIMVGVIFLWAGLEKLTMGDGQGGPFNAGGFLKFATNGTLGWPFVSGTPADGTVFNPTHGFWASLAANPGLMTAINTLVVAGEIGIGIALILGLATGFAGAMGTLMMLFFFFAAWDFAFGIVNQHLAYALICATLTGLGAGKYYGLDGVIADRVSPTIRKYFLSGDPVPQTGGALPAPAPVTA